MNIIIEVFEGAKSLRSAELEVVEAEKVAAVLERVAKDLGIDHAELILNIGVGDVNFDPNSTVGEVIRHGHHWHHRRVCVDLRFENEVREHHFSSRAPWAVVHAWGCSHFGIVTALCANLQLHEGTPKGPVLNERLQLGHFHGCKTVWLVKPGPEPNGR